MEHYKRAPLLCPSVLLCSLLMSEWQNIELDKLFFYFYHVLFIDMVFSWFFFFFLSILHCNCQYVYNDEGSLVFNF